MSTMWAMSRRRKVAVGVVGTLVTLNGVYGAWAWLENTRLVNQITRSFISPELEEALQSIKGVVAAFERDVRTDVKWDWKRDRVPSALVNLLILNTIHERAAALQAPPKEGVRTRSSLLPGDEIVGREAARYIRFASSAYGMFMLKGANVMSWDSGWPPVHKFSLQELNSWCITKHCGILDEDLVKVNLFEERTLHLPGYILAVDHATRSVVLSVRGTFSMQDTVTDLVCDSADFMGGSCHRGLRRSAETLLEDARDDLLRHLEQHKGYRLVLCGHSLGGGVSILLTMMLLKRRRELGLGGTEVLCYAFAPPPVFAPLEKLSGQTRRAIRSFVFGNDMVCRLSLATAYGLFRDLKEVDAIGASLPARCKYLALERRPHLSVDDDGRGAVGMRVAYRYATILHRTRSRGGNGSDTKSRQNGVGAGGGVGGGGGGMSGGGTAGGSGSGVGGGGYETHPVEAFVRKKLAQDFTATGTAATPPPATASARRPPLRKRRLTSGAAWRHGYELPGFEPAGLDRLGDGGGGGGGDGSDVGGRYKKLMIPGSIYHMKKLGPESKAAGAAAMLGGTPSEMRSRLYWMEKERAEEFARLLMVDTAIVDHLPAAYEDALHALYGDGLPQREQEQG